MKIGKITLTGGDGSSVENAIIIKGAKNSSEGIRAEYQYIENIYGQRNKEWKFVSQSLLHDKGKSYDKLSIKVVETKKKIDFFFNITSFFGKF